MIKYNLNDINDWNYGDDNIKKVYYHNSICYQKISKGETPPTPSFNGKWKATYSDGRIESANCDSSSAITKDEIPLENLTAVVIGDCVTSIGDVAFYECRSLTSVTISSGVTSIGTYAFNDCSGLTSVTIPNSVTSIGDVAFQGCSGLTSVTIGNGVTSIGTGAFYNCGGLASITVNATTPPTVNSHSFDYTNNCPIYVPAESVNAYKSANGWKTYASRIFPIQ